MVVQQLVVSETHVAMLTEDGRICRIRYTEETTPPPPLAMPATGREKRCVCVCVWGGGHRLIQSYVCSDDEAASTSSTRSYGSRSASPRQDDDRPSTSSLYVHLHTHTKLYGP